MLRKNIEERHTFKLKGGECSAVHYGETTVKSIPPEPASFYQASLFQQHLQLQSATLRILKKFTQQKDFQQYHGTIAPPSYNEFMSQQTYTSHNPYATAFVSYGSCNCPSCRSYFNTTPPRPFNEETNTVLQADQTSDQFILSDELRDDNGEEKFYSPVLHQFNRDTVRQNGNLEEIPPGVESSSSRGTANTSATNQDFRVEQHTQLTEPLRGRENHVVPRVQNGISVARSVDVDKRPIDPVNANPNSDILGTEDKDNADQQISRAFIRSGEKKQPVTTTFPLRQSVQNVPKRTTQPTTDPKLQSPSSSHEENKQRLNGPQRKISSCVKNDRGSHKEPCTHEHHPHSGKTLHDTTTATDEHNHLRKKSTHSGQATKHRGAHRPFVGEWFRDTKSKVARDDSLPLHSPQVNAIDLNKLDSLADEHDRWCHLKKFLDDATLFHDIPHMPSENLPRSELMRGDVEKLIQSGNFRLGSHGEATRFTTAFSVIEQQKNRRRFIQWPKQINDFVGPMFTSNVDDTMNLIRPKAHDFVRQFDMKCGYYQFELSDAVARNFAIKVAQGRIIFPKRLPMGYSPSADICAAALELLAKNTSKKVRVKIHVDNIRFEGPQQEVQQAAETFLERCRYVGATVVEETPQEFLGVEFQVSPAQVLLSNKVRIAQRTLKKISDSKKVLNNDTLTVGQLRELLSRCIYGSRVLRIPLANYFGVIKCCRRRFATTSSNDERTTVWQCVKKQWMQWIQKIEENSWTERPAHISRTELCLFCDASTTGWGAVLLGQDVCTAAQGKWEKRHDASEINFLEAKALSLATSTFLRHLQKVDALDVFMDNTSCVHALKKGSAHSFLLNKEIEKALAELPRHVDIAIRYIKTGDNPADQPSRGDVLSLERLASAVGFVGRERPEKVFRIIPSGLRNKKPQKKVKASCDNVEP